jgi:hypothetical protein
VNRLKVWLFYGSYAVLFAAVFAIMLVMLVTAAVGVPSGIMISVFGVAILVFKADFIITELAPQLMIFGGISAACASAFCGLLAAKAGMAAAALFVRVRRHCDKLRGWN